MAGWQEELDELLQRLGVTQEEPQTKARASSKPTRSNARRRPRPGKSFKHLADAFLTENPTSDEADINAWMADLDAMRREVEDIVRQVIQVMQNGDLDPSFKEDVMVVLHELRRPAISQQPSSSPRAYLETVSAMLHFCRLVLLLSETALEDQ